MVCGLVGRQFTSDGGGARLSRRRHPGAAGLLGADDIELINNPAGKVSEMLKRKRLAKEFLRSMVGEAEEGIERLASMRS